MDRNKQHERKNTTQQMMLMCLSYELA